MRELTAKVTVMALVLGLICAVAPAFADENQVTALQGQVQNLNDKVDNLERALRTIEERGPAPSTPHVGHTAQPETGLLKLSQDVNIGGYVEAQWNNNFTQPRSTGARSAVSTATGGVGTNRVRSYDRYDGSFSVNAAKLYLEKPVTEPKTAGFRIDLKFGEDSNFTNANGSTNTDNLVDLEQAYVQYKAPLVEGSKILPDAVDVKVGRFFTLAGFEVVDGPANWNVSRSLMYTYAAPFTHTGIRTQTAWFEGKVDAYLGVNNGWDRAIDNNAMKTIETGLAYSPLNDVKVMHAFYFGPEVATTEGGKTWVFTNNVNWQATDKLSLGGDYELGSQHGARNIAGTGAVPAGVDDPTVGNNAWWWGLAGYAKYKFTDKFSVASRSEMFHDTQRLRTTISDSYFEQTLTAEYLLTDNLITRAEFRWDRANDQSVFGFGNGAVGERSSQTTIGGQVIYLI